LETTERAFAKLNLSLDVLGATPDGYHELVSVMQGVSLGDCVTLRLTRGEGAAVTGRGLPRDKRNTAVKAALKFFEITGISGCRAEIALEKRIPVGAGLGGGSADAAAVLRALDRLLDTNLTPAALRDIGAAVGSDVPFCLEGGTALATGRGEKLEPLPALPECRVVVAKPAFSVSTPELFAEIDGVKLRRRPDTDGLVAALRSGDLSGVARRMYNVFEDVLPERRGAVILDIKSRLLDLGALGAVMSGTGSAVFGLFDDDAAATRAHETLRRDFRECYMCSPLERGLK
jgi:4-diphosphocytidyl-2-C-methyl-D-erythritol kinase